jgi:hypothetical protein
MYANVPMIAPDTSSEFGCVLVVESIETEPRVLMRARHTEVENLDRPVRGQVDVRRLQVTVHDALVVRDAQCLANLNSDLDDLACCNGSALEASCERLARDVFHDDECAVVGFDDVMDAGDEWVIQPRRRACFVEEPAARIEVMEARLGELLERDLAAQDGVLGEKNFAFSAGAKRREDAEPFEGRDGHRPYPVLPEPFLDSSRAIDATVHRCNGETGRVARGRGHVEDDQSLRVVPGRLAPARWQRNSSPRAAFRADLLQSQRMAGPNQAHS